MAAEGRNSFELDTVERHLKSDEESSTDESKNSISSQMHIRDEDPSCSTPPRLERLHKSSNSENDNLTSIDAIICNDIDSPIHFLLPKLVDSSMSSWLSLPQTTAGEFLGLQNSVFQQQQPTAAPRIPTSDTFSLSSDSSDIDSDQELEIRAKAIRADLRMQQLLEIAAIAERAADAGHDTFTGLASTFGTNDTAPEVVPVPVTDTADAPVRAAAAVQNKASVDALKKPIHIQRNHTYSEGQPQHRRRRIIKSKLSLLRKSSTERQLRRKIPVMALRHIHDLIPPLKDLHLHLRSHLYREGVDTESSLTDQPMDLKFLDAKSDNSESNKSTIPKKSFIGRLTGWVTSTSDLTGDSTIHKQAVEKENTQVLSISEYIDFDLGDLICGHITRPEVAAGFWKASPLKLPSSFIPFDEDDFEDTLTTPKPSSFSRFLQRNIETPTLKSDPRRLPTKYSRIHENKHSSTSTGKAEIDSIALFDECEENDESMDLMIIGSQDFPEPFGIPNTPYTPSQQRDIKESPNSYLNASSDAKFPHVFLTPVRLKGLRDIGWKPSYEKSSAMAYNPFSRSDSFKSEKESPVNSILMDNASPSPAFNGFVNPTRKSVNEIISTILISSEMVYRAKEISQNPTELCMPSLLMGVEHQDNSRSILPSSVDVENPSEGDNKIEGNNIHDQSTLSKGSTTLDHMDGFHRDPIENVSVILDNAFVESPASLDESLYRLPDASRGDMISSDDNMDESTLVKKLDRKFDLIHAEDNLVKHSEKRLTKTLESDVKVIDHVVEVQNLRRVASCPTLVDTNDAEESVYQMNDIPKDSKVLPKALFNALSPSSKLKNDRNILFTSESNHDYLNNYLYFGKPRDQVVKHDLESLSPISNPCGVEASGCNLLLAASETASFLCRPLSPQRDRSFLPFDTDFYKEYGDLRSGTQSWFDTASEKFDSALERLVQPWRKINRNEWRKSYQAPTLSIKTPQSARKAMQYDDATIQDPRKVKGIVLLPQQPRAPSPVSNVKISEQDETFFSIYGLTREEFRDLSLEERCSVWEERLKAMNTNTSPSIPSASDDVVTKSEIQLRRQRRHHQQHRTSFSTTFIPLTP